MYITWEAVSAGLAAFRKQHRFAACRIRQASQEGAATAPMDTKPPEANKRLTAGTPNGCRLRPSAFRVGLDYHVEIDKHYYSVPHQLLREKVWARPRTVEVFHRGKRVAAHVVRHQIASIRRCASSCRRATGAMPIGRWRASGGMQARLAATRQHVETILRERTHPEQGFRACVGIVPASSREKRGRGPPGDRPEHL
jgi:hypothetical protein